MKARELANAIMTLPPELQDALLFVQMPDGIMYEPMPESATAVKWLLRREGMFGVDEATRPEYVYIRVLPM